MSTHATKLKLYQKIFFGMGDISGTFSNTIIGFFYLFFLTDIVGLRPAYAGAAILLGKLWDAVTDPMVGNISDRTNSRWGRRRAFLLFGTLPLGITFFMLWIIPGNLSQFQLFLYATITYMFHMTSITAVMVPYQTLTGEMTLDYNERTSLIGYRMLFSIFGGLVAVILPKTIMDAFQVKSTGFIIMGIVFGICIGIAPIFPFLGCKEKKYTNSQNTSYIKDLLSIWKNKPFRYVLMMFLMTWTAINLLQTMFMYFFKYWLMMDDKFEIIVGLIFIVATLLIPFWVIVSKKIGKKNAYILGMGFLGICIIGIIFIPQGLLWLTLLMAFLIGIGISAAHVIPHSIIPDSIDYGQLQTGERKEGIYFGILTFVQKLGTAAAIGFSGLLLDWMGYVPDITQSPKVLLTIRTLLGPVPGILLLIGILCIYFYPINKKVYDEMQQKISSNNQGKVETNNA